MQKTHQAVIVIRTTSFMYWGQTVKKTVDICTRTYFTDNIQNNRRKINQFKFQRLCVAPQLPK